jgi:hypothetical protein
LLVLLLQLISLNLVGLVGFEATTVTMEAVPIENAKSGAVKAVVGVKIRRPFLNWGKNGGV